MQFPSIPFAWDFSMYLAVVFISDMDDVGKDEDLLSQSPKTYGDRIFSFPHIPVDHHARGFSVQRKGIANKTSNPRLLKFNFLPYLFDP
jgi:hypothetical protein